MNNLITYNDSNWYFPSKYKIIVRNRTHSINSRNIYQLDLWEPFKILSPAKGENQLMGEEYSWFKIIFKNNLIGYIKKDVDKIKLINNKNTEKYLLSSNYFYKKNYILATELLSELLLNNNLYPEQVIIFYFQNLKNIAIRSTSVDNPYTKFAIAYPKLFKVDENSITLQVNDFLGKLLFKTNPKSTMLQYLK